MAVARPLLAPAIYANSSRLSTLALKKQAHMIIRAEVAGAWSGTRVRRRLTDTQRYVVVATSSCCDRH